MKGTYYQKQYFNPFILQDKNSRKTTYKELTPLINESTEGWKTYAHMDHNAKAMPRVSRAQHITNP